MHSFVVLKNHSGSGGGFSLFDIQGMSGHSGSGSFFQFLGKVSIKCCVPLTECATKERVPRAAGGAWETAPSVQFFMHSFVVLKNHSGSGGSFSLFDIQCIAPLQYRNAEIP
jgi:hypothetical protein